MNRKYKGYLLYLFCLLFSVALHAKTYSFAGEKVPVENFDVAQRLDRELIANAYAHASTISYIKLSGMYFPVIETILKEQGIPDDFKYLAVAESGLRNANSAAGAHGFWQMMPTTAQGYGLTVNEYIDERLHLEKATLAACKYFKEAKEKFGSWTLTAAAYNRGINGLERDIAAQKETSYYDMNLNVETMRYVFRIVAIKEIMTNPTAFGFNIDQKYDPMPKGRKVKVEAKDGHINLVEVKEEYGISYRMLKLYNPWLLDSQVKDLQGELELEIPQ